MIAIIFGQGRCRIMFAPDRYDRQLLALVSDLTGDRYIFLYEDNDTCADAAIQVVGRFANNPDIALTWDEAATLARQIRSLRETARKANSSSSSSNSKPPTLPQDPWRKPK